MKMSCAKSCFFCLENVDAATCSEIVKNLKNVEIQPLLHYLAGVDPSSDGESPGSSARIPMITQLPPLCLPCYEKFGQLHQLHQNLLDIQRLIQSLTLEMRKTVSECSSKVRRGNRKSKLVTCHAYPFQDNLGAGTATKSQDDFKDLRDLIIGSNDVIFPSRWRPPPSSGATIMAEGNSPCNRQAESSTEVEPVEVDDQLIDSDTDAKRDNFTKLEHSALTDDNNDKNNYVHDHDDDDDDDDHLEPQCDSMDEASEKSDLSDNDWEVEATGKRKSCSKKETESKNRKPRRVTTTPNEVKPNEFPCQYCDKTYATFSGLTWHYKKYHPERYATEIPKRGYKPVPYSLTTKPDNVAAQKCSLCANHRVIWVELSKMGLHVEAHLGNGHQGWKCEVCTKVYPTRSMILHHLKRSPECSKSSSNDAVKMHVCKLCLDEEKFNFEADLFNHISDVHEMDESLEKLHKCPRCDSEFRTELGLDFHMNKHVTNWGSGWRRRFQNGRVPCTKDIQKCKLCDKMIPGTGQEMKIHLTTEHKVTGFIKCKLCRDSDEFIDHEEYLSHLQSQHNEKDAMKPCDLCESEIFDRIFELRKHYFHIHQIGSQYMCDQCSGILYTEESLRVHVRKHHGKTQGKFACEFCLKSGDTKKAYLSTKKLFEKHLATVHPLNRFKCERPQCTAQFRCKADFMEHEKSDHQNDPLTCPVNPTGCSEFLHALYLRAHVVQVHNRKPAVNSPMFKCSSCDKAFQDACHLKRHEQIHSEEKPFQCDQCPKSFKTEQYFKSHQLIHLPGGKPRPFVCDVCSRAFFNAKLLKQHAVIHTGERPFSCQFCGMTFRHLAARRTHELGHKNKKENFRSRGTFERGTKGN